MTKCRKRKAVVYTIILMLINISAIMAVSAVQYEHPKKNIGYNNIIIVDDEGDGNFTDLQPAVDAAKSGDTILVYSGNYTGPRLVDKKSISIIGNSSEYLNGTSIGCPRVDGELNGNVFYLESSNDNKICGFEIFNSGTELGNAGIYAESSYRNTFCNNTIHHCRKGIFLKYSDWNEISRNYIRDNDGNGVHMEDLRYSIITANHIKGNINGIVLDGCKRNTICYNQIYDNSQYAIYTYNRYPTIPDLNLIIHNNFINNSRGCFNVFSMSIWRYNYWNQKNDNNIPGLPPKTDTIPSERIYNIPLQGCK